jgi:PAS domain S-box-containing protein
MTGNAIKALIVEDNRSDSRLIQLELDQISISGIEIDIAARLDEAVRKLQDSQFDVVLLDLNLPDSAGFETITRIRKEAPPVPIIVLTGAGDDAAGVEAIHLGVQDYLVKGETDGKTLWRAIHYAVERWRLEGALRRSEEQFRNMFAGHQAIMMLIEPETGAIVDANPAAVAFYRYPREILHSLKIQDINLLPPDKVAAFRKKTLEEGAGRYMFQHRLADGEVRWVEVNSTPIDIRGRRLLFSIIYDITERRTAQEALEKALEEKEALLNELRASERELKEQNRIMVLDLKIAHAAQKDLIQKVKPECERLNVDHRYWPKELVGGDYFSFFGSDDGSLGFFIGDVSGHGIASALFIALLKSSTERMYKNYGSDPSAFMKHLNRDLVNSMATYFVTGIYGIFTPCAGERPVELKFSNGGHPNPVLVRPHGEVIQVGHANIIVGVTDDAEFLDHDETLGQGDRIFFFTDGIPETLNENREMIGYENGLVELFQKTRRNSLSDTLDEVLEEVYRFRGAKSISDDITIIGFEVN